MERNATSILLLFLACLCAVLGPSHAFVITTKTRSGTQPGTVADRVSGSFGGSPSSSSTTRLRAYNDEEEKEEIEKARIGIWNSRRGEIRGMLRSAESLRNFRFENGFVPELDEVGNPIKSDGKTAVTLTAFAVAAGAIVLRVGGRAALVSAVGLDFMTENPDLQNQINQVLEMADTVDPLLKAGLFCVGWTFVKTLCFDAGGIVLAFASGILFGGVIQGAVMSAFGATVGSSVAFGLAKADTPVRKKAIEIVEENPSLRGLEKVVADEGLKAVLTLRLAPVLPIPLGMYNYVYGISNVRFADFAGGIFLGSLKPYFLDSYLGYFGKSLIDGTVNDGGMQDYLLIGVLGFSVLIGVFASQLAGETWEAVLKEQEAEDKRLKEGDDAAVDDDDDVMTEVFGFELPQWLVGFQYALNDAGERIDALVLQEYDAKVWNYTTAELSMFSGAGSRDRLPDDRNPALIDPASPEIADRYGGVDFGASTCDGLVLSPILFSYFLRFSDPLFDEAEFRAERERDDAAAATTVSVVASTIPDEDKTGDTPSSTPPASVATADEPSLEFKEGVFLNQLQQMKDETERRIDEANRKLEQLKSDGGSFQ